MAKPEWGTKRSCQECGAKFYDFARVPIACPKCEAVFQLEVPSRSRKAAKAPEETKAKVVAVAKKDDAKSDDDGIEDVAVDDDDDDDLMDDDDIDDDMDDDIDDELTSVDIKTGADEDETL